MIYALTASLQVVWVSPRVSIPNALFGPTRKTYSTVHAQSDAPLCRPLHIYDTYHGSFEHSEELDGKAVRGGAKKLGAWLNLGDMPQNEVCEGKGRYGGLRR